MMPKRLNLQIFLGGRPLSKPQDSVPPRQLQYASTAPEEGATDFVDGLFGPWRKFLCYSPVDEQGGVTHPPY
jgi:hypothetical protein